MSTRRLRLAGLATLTVVSTSACSVGLEDLPLPAPGVDGPSYTLTATFSNALNLPASAKVKRSGVDIGEVESMAVDNYSAVVTMSILDDVQLPVGTTAELRSATPLGDIFVALSPPADAPPDAEMLADGANIPEESTSAAATIEDVLTTAALLVNGGVLRDTTKIVNGLGAAVGDRGDGLTRIIDQSTQLIGNLAARNGELQNVLGETATLTSTLAGQQQTIDDVLSAAAPAAGAVAVNTDQTLALVAELDRITTQLERYPSIAGTAPGGLVADLNTIADELARAANNPDADLTAVNKMLAPIIKITNSTSAHPHADLEDLAIGALADPNHPGDPGSRVPDATDSAAFAGTIAYTLQRLRDRVFGPGR
ncbi:MlaD family protein [Rhodococcus gannanensis]|uniref:MlaD family protein n=1 Tax=Rhodococcus gannanensis TaxID=1960308 RepID=A0ABW4P9A6_9NOCA